MSPAPAPIPVVPLPIPRRAPGSTPPSSSLPAGVLLLAAGPWLLVLLVALVLALLRTRFWLAAPRPWLPQLPGGGRRSPAGPIHDAGYLAQILRAELEADALAAEQAAVADSRRPSDKRPPTDAAS